MIKKTIVVIMIVIFSLFSVTGCSCSDNGSSYEYDGDDVLND